MASLKYKVSCVTYAAVASVNIAIREEHLVLSDMAFDILTGRYLPTGVLLNVFTSKNQYRY